MRDMSFESRFQMCLAAKSFPIGNIHNKDQKEVVTGLALNDLAFIGQAHEIFSEFSLRLKRNSPFKATFVIGLNGDCDFYVPTSAAWEEGGYESNLGLKQDNFDKILQEAMRVLGRLNRKMR